MAKIIYGVSGEGSGHSSRARLIASYLLKQGHQVKLVTYDRGFANLKEDFDAFQIVGLTIVSVDNEVSKLKTISENLKKIPSGKKSLKALKKLFKDFSPDCVITDFEPSTAYLANHYKIPLISLDNQHRMRYMKYKIPPSLKKDALITETVIRAMVPKPWVSLVTSFHEGKLANKHTYLFPPILRESVLALNSTDDDHLLVYLTSGFDSLIEVLKTFTRERFVVYGYNKEEVEGNLHFRAFSKQGFLQDLASCKGVIATAGFTLICEALYLGKPYLALPMEGQFEQQLNAHMLHHQGYGAKCTKPSKKELSAFFYNLPDFKQALANYPKSGNASILNKLDELLSNDLSVLKRHQRT